MHHNLAAAGLFGQVIRKNYPVVVANKITGEQEEVSVVGPLCTPLDLLADDMQLTVAEPVDLIAVHEFNVSLSRRRARWSCALDVPTAIPVMAAISSC